MDIEANRAPTFKSVEEYARSLTLAYPAAQSHALERLARHGLRRRDDGLYELKIAPALRGAVRPSASRSEGGSDAMSPEAQWAMLGRIRCPTLVVRGAASDILSPDTADKMVDEVRADARLAVVPQAGHSVMTDNPEGFEEALSGFLLSEE
jgi:pimeloyl-ACP methyl ester carboxylesterase